MRRLWPEPGEIADVAAEVAAAARPTPAGRPWLLVNMIASLDGAVTVDGRSGGLGRPADKAVFSALRGVADVVLAGAGTVRTEGYGPPRPPASIRAARAERGQAPVPRLAVISRSLDLDPESELFTAAAEPPYVLTCDAAPPDRRVALADRAELVVAGDGAVDLPVALASLGDRGVATVCCEGGPTLNGQLLADDLVDEWALTVAPLLVGGANGRASDAAGGHAPRAMRLAWLAEGDGLLLSRWVRDVTTDAA